MMKRTAKPLTHLTLLCALLLLTAAMLACGGSDKPTDEPSSERATAERTELPDSEPATAGPTDLPDSERATNEPEGGTPSRQITAAPTTEGAEPSLTPMAATAAPTTEGAEPSSTPRATARPPLAQTSPETDREVLVTLYNAMDGPNWKNSDRWLTDFPIGEWKGVTTDDNGRVTSLYFGVNQMTGEIPPELGNLASLQRLQFGQNQLTGEIPPELGNLENLTILEPR